MHACIHAHVGKRMYMHMALPASSPTKGALAVAAQSIWQSRRQGPVQAVSLSAYGVIIGGRSRDRSTYMHVHACMHAAGQGSA